MNYYAHHRVCFASGAYIIVKEGKIYVNGKQISCFLDPETREPCVVELEFP